MYSNPFRFTAQQPSGAAYGQQRPNVNPYQQLAGRQQGAQQNRGQAQPYGGGMIGNGGGTGGGSAPSGVWGQPGSGWGQPGGGAAFNPYAQNRPLAQSGGGISTGQGAAWGRPNPYSPGQDYNGTMQNMNQMGQMLSMSGADPSQMQYAMQGLMGGRSMDDMMKRLQSQMRLQGVQNSNQYGPQSPAYLSGYGW